MNWRLFIRPRRSDILENGGAGYFPRRLTERAVADGRLHLVPDTPRFHHRVHMIFDSNRKDERFNTALQGLRFVAAREGEH